MKLHGIIRRRLLVNFRLDPDRAQRLLPSPFRPKLHEGFAVGGICLIRLEEIRPKRFPKMLGLTSENAAHRIAVTWSDASGEREGVYIPRRDSGALFNQLAGGRLFPGEQQRAHFDVEDDGRRIDFRMTSADRAVSVAVRAEAAREWAPGSIFASLQEASDFFERGALGYSARSSGDALDGMLLKTERWEVQPLRVESVSSSYFPDATFACALIMRDVAHEWESAAAPATAL